MPTTPEELGRFIVSISSEGAVVETVRFDNLEDAERFLEQRTDEAPGVTGVIDDDSIDHTAAELVELDTALTEDHDRDS
ncbi:MAG: hypothetical protein HKO87_05495 [Acidimicrobiia bacterium]|nr:hypothetical protein [Acidimicrobiia bacterium]